MASQERQPNVIYIYADQMRADAMGCAGNPDVKTPNIDRLSNEGVRFQEAFVSYPLCTPFRGSFLTGKYAHAVGLYSNHFPIPLNHRFLPQLMRDGGYNTAYIGKWHLFGGPKPGFVPPGENRLGFETFIGFNRGHEYSRSIFYRDTDQPYHSMRHEPDYQTDQFIEFMDDAISAEDARPFFGYLCFGPPHHPMKIPDHWKKMYDPNKITLPHGVPNPDLQREVGLHILNHDYGGDPTISEYSKTERRKIPPGEPETEEEIREFIAEYYGMISNVDFNVGRILNWLDAMGIAHDTVVVFFSDHGDMCGQHGHYCGVKRLAYRGSMQVPIIVRYPARFPAGHTPRSMIDVSIDTMPTILELCGIDIPEEVQGVSYLPLLDGADEPTRDHVFFELMLQSVGTEGDAQPVPRRGIRTKDWLYVREEDRRNLLIDEQNDPLEDQNIVQDASKVDLMDSLDRRIFDIMEKTGDDWRLEMSFPPPDFVSHRDAARLHGEELEQRAIVVP